MAVGVPDADAKKVAELMLEADLTGADAHGVFRLPQYVRRIKAGGVNPRAASSRKDRAGDRHGRRRQRHGPSGDAARRRHRDRVGQGERRVLGRRRRSNHAGAAGTYAAMALPHDMIGIYSAVANANHMPAWGAAESLLSTNPIAVAISGWRRAAGGARHRHHGRSYGTVKAAKLQGKPMPEGWMISARDGKPITEFREKRRRSVDADRRP